MIYIVIGIIFAAVILAGFLLHKKSGSGKEYAAASEGANQSPIAAVSGNTAESVQSAVLIIPVEKLPAEAIQDESRLVEITDKNMVAHIGHLIPNLIQTGNSVNNAVNAVQLASGEIYKAVIPSGAKLTPSASMEGAVRGFYQNSSGRFQGQANFIKVDPHKGAIIASSAMQVGALVVGQYYMTQITQELSTIHDGISRIQDFQENEFKSRIQSLLARVKRIAEFQTEILNNDELRISEINQLGSLEGTCTDLLGQTNFTLKQFVEPDIKKYEDYEKAVQESQVWFEYQSILLAILSQISDLSYALHFGEKSRAYCSSLLLNYQKKSNEALECLARWHKDISERFGIDLSKKQIRRTGVDGLVHNFIGLFDEDKKYRPINEKTVVMIEVQSSACDHLDQSSSSELYNKDVQLISKNGKLYYLPEYDD